MLYFGGGNLTILKIYKVLSAFLLIFVDRTGDFTKQQNNIMDTLGTVYDYGSIMHYSSTTFSINGKPTLVPKFNTHGNMGQRSEMSEVDIWKINKLYGCENGKYFHYFLYFIQNHSLPINFLKYFYQNLFSLNFKIYFNWNFKIKRSLW